MSAAWCYRSLELQKEREEKEKAKEKETSPHSKNGESPTKKGNTRPTKLSRSEMAAELKDCFAAAREQGVEPSNRWAAQSRSSVLSEGARWHANTRTEKKANAAAACGIMREEETTRSL